MDGLHIADRERVLAFRRGDLRAGERLATELARDPETRRDARAILERILRQDPGRVDAIHALHRVTDALGDVVASRAVASVLRLFDPSVPKRRSGAFERIPTPSHEGLDALVPRRASALEEVFHFAWSSVPGLAGREAQTYAVSTREDVAAATAFASRVLRVPPARLFVGPDGSKTASALPSRRPAIVVGPELDPKSSEGIFRLGRALFSTRPGIAVALAPTAERAVSIHQGVAVAFGPAPEGQHPISDEAGGLIRELWGLPLHVQRRLQGLCGHGVLGKPEEWQLAMRQCANRAGLLVAGDAAACLRVVANERIRGFEPTSPAAYRAAVDASRDFADLAAFAISPEYFALRR